MIKEIIMPKLGETMEEGYLVSWKKDEGDAVEQGDVLFEVMSDKTNFDVESQSEGVLRKILYQPGDDPIPVTTVIGYIAGSMEEPLPQTTGKDEKAVDKKVTGTTEKVERKTPAVSSEETPKSEHEEKRIAISPVARKLAEEKGIDITLLKGSGPGGRIQKKDILDYKEAEKEEKISGGEEDTVKEWTPLRRIIAKRLTESKQQIPHYYFQGKFIVDGLLNIKDYMKNKNSDITFTDFVIYIASKAIEEYPLINAAAIDNRTRLYKSVDIGLAVAVEEGLLVPVIKNCSEKGISEISRDRRALIARARDNKLGENDLKGARFVISNLGMYGVENFQPIISPPGTAIMGVGAIQKIPMVIGDKIEIRSALNVSFSFDHRIVDGAYAGLFYKKFKELMENPAILAF